MNTLGYYNGSYGELEVMRVPMLDRACYFGDAVYDATYSRNHKIFALDEHVDRLFVSAHRLDIAVPMKKEALKKLLKELVELVDDGEQFVYFQISRGTGLREHALSDLTSNLLIMLKPQKIKDMTAPYRLVTCEDMRYKFCDIKTINLIPNIMASRMATNFGADECVFVRKEIVTECAHSNICCLYNNILFLPPANMFILDGIARRHLICVAKENGIKIVEDSFSLEFLLAADEIIVTSSGALCMRALNIDDKNVGGRAPKTIALLQEKLLEKFYNATNL